MTEPIKANAATNLRVAIAAGIDAGIESRGLSAFGCVCDVVDVCIRLDADGPGDLFSPTTDERHAREAAEAVGLFEDQCNNLSKRKDGWCFENHKGKGCSIRTYYGTTCCLALCEAILAVAEKGGNDV